MKISNKVYYCPVCGNEENHSTNHYGEIYTSCRKCSNTGLYCKENPPTNHDKTAQIVFYRFNLDNSEGVEYTNLIREITKRGFSKFSCLIEWKTIQALKTHDRETVYLYNSTQFDNQYVSNIGRIFNWFEAAYPNRDIREGYYLIFE